MTEIPLASKSDPGKSRLVSQERLLNLYAEESPSKGRSTFALYRTPGLASYVPISTQLCRGLIALEDQGTLIGVFGSDVFQSDADKNYNQIDGILLGNDDLVIARNTASPDPQVAFFSETAAYYTDGESIDEITNSDYKSFGVAHSGCFIKGFIIAGFPDGTMLSSAIQDVTDWNALDFASADASPDDLRRVYSYRDELFAFGKDVVEVWAFDTSNTAFPLSPVPGAVVPVGIIGKQAVCDLGGVLYWVDQFGVVRSLSQGYSAERISNNGVERAISDYLKTAGSRDGVKVWGYIEGGHQFIIVRSPSFCWVYDAATKIWHERRSYRRDTWRAKHYARCFDTHIVSGDISGELFSLDNETYEESGEPLIWEAVLPPVDAFPNGGVIDRLSLDIETGTGLGGSASAEDQEPIIAVDISRDGGKTFGIARQVSLGKHAQYSKRVSLNRLGAFDREGATIRIKGSARVRMAILRADLSARPRNLQGPVGAGA